MQLSFKYCNVILYHISYFILCYISDTAIIQILQFHILAEKVCQSRTTAQCCYFKMQQIWIPPRSNFLSKVIAVEGNLWRNSVENKCILYTQRALAWKGSFEEPIFFCQHCTHLNRCFVLVLLRVIVMRSNYQRFWAKYWKLVILLVIFWRKKKAD